MLTRRLSPYRGTRSPSLIWNEENPFRIFDRLLTEWNGLDELESSSAFVPSLDIADNETEIRVETELPGIAEKDIDVEFHNDILTIKGEKSEEHKEEKDNYYRSERSFGSFSRSVRLPADTVDGAQIDAKYKNGVLTIHLPKKKEKVESARKIKVTS